MRRITQTIIVGDGSGLPGNCLQAAVASLVGHDLDAVPHFALYPDWFERLAAFGHNLGYSVQLRPPPERPAQVFGLLFGPSPRGVSHAVAVEDAIVWDPHPSRDGLVSVSEYVAWVHRSRTYRTAER